MNAGGQENRRGNFDSPRAASALTVASGVLELVVGSCQTFHCQFNAATFTLHRDKRKSDGLRTVSPGAPHTGSLLLHTL